MSASRAFTLAIDRAKRERDDALAQLRQVLLTLHTAQDQMRQLEQYAQETEQRWIVSAQRRTAPELLQHHYQFMDRLNQAIGLQSGVLVQIDQRLSAARDALLAREVRLASLRHALAARELAQARQAARREQKQMDEFAQQQHMRRVRQGQESST
ncbi:MAG: flagellar export protein FliJ [Rhodoferax sp.]